MSDLKTTSHEIRTKNEKNFAFENLSFSSQSQENSIFFRKCHHDICKQVMMKSRLNDTKIHFTRHLRDLKKSRNVGREFVMFLHKTTTYEARIGPNGNEQDR